MSLRDVTITWDDETGDKVRVTSRTGSMRRILGIWRKLRELCLSPYSETFNSKVIKRFRTWTKKSLRVSEFRDSYVLSFLHVTCVSMCMSVCLWECTGVCISLRVHVCWLLPREFAYSWCIIKFWFSWHVLYVCLYSQTHHIYIYIYIYMCVCVCVSVRKQN